MLYYVWKCHKKRLIHQEESAVRAKNEHEEDDAAIKLENLSL